MMCSLSGVQMKALCTAIALVIFPVMPGNAGETSAETDTFLPPGASVRGPTNVRQVALASPIELLVRTYTYKQVGDLAIKADVHTSGERPVRPVVVWIHGGALIMGHREGIDQRLKQAFLDKGYAVVSIDYRLAPETQLPQIIEDVEDAFR